MGLIDKLMQQGGLPGQNQAKRIAGGGNLSPMRGVMPGFQSGFSPYYQSNVLEELLRRLTQMHQQNQQMSTRHANFPLGNPGG